MFGLIDKTICDVNLKVKKTNGLNEWSSLVVLLFFKCPYHFSTLCRKEFITLQLMEVSVSSFEYFILLLIKRLSFLFLSGKTPLLPSEGFIPSVYLKSTRSSIIYIYFKDDKCWVIYFKAIFLMQFNRFQDIGSFIMIAQGLCDSALQRKRD